MAFLKSNPVKRFLWLTAGGALALVVTYMTGLQEVGDYWYLAPIIAIINSITKEINNKYGKTNQ